MSENAVSKNHLSTKESASCWTTKNNSSTTSHTDTYSTLHIRKPRQDFLIFSYHSPYFPYQKSCPYYAYLCCAILR